MPKLPCPKCGKEYEWLAMHLRKKHGMDFQEAIELQNKVLEQYLGVKSNGSR